MSMHPRQLILGLILAAEGAPVAARELVRACGLFDIEAGCTRVALARLASEGFIKTESRGMYTPGKNWKKAKLELEHWPTDIEHLRDWTGNYIMAFTNHLGRVDRAKLRRRERAFTSLGFRELEQGLFVRPDNIDEDLDSLSKRLIKLGVEPKTHFFIAQSFSEKQLDRITKLWNVDALNQHYVQQQRLMNAWLSRSANMEINTAARESYLMSLKALQAVQNDPLLPEPLIDQKARQAFFSTVREMDQAGKHFWAQFYKQSGHLDAHYNPMPVRNRYRREPSNKTNNPSNKGGSKVNVSA